jgi:hypothetical protein
MVCMLRYCAILPCKRLHWSHMPHVIPKVSPVAHPPQLEF